MVDRQKSCRKFQLLQRPVRLNLQSHEIVAGSQPDISQFIILCQTEDESVLLTGRIDRYFRVYKHGIPWGRRIETYHAIPPGSQPKIILFIILNHHRRISTSHLIGIRDKLIFFFVQMIYPTIPHRNNNFMVATLTKSGDGGSSVFIPDRIFFNQLPVGIIFSQYRAIPQPHRAVTGSIKIHHWNILQTLRIYRMYTVIRFIKNICPFVCTEPYISFLILSDTFYQVVL